MPVMSFNVTVAVKDGRATVTTSGEVPDGELTISGQEGDTRRVLAVTRRGPDGRYVQQATAIHHKEIG